MPSAAVIDSQSVKGGQLPPVNCGYEAGKKDQGAQAPCTHRHQRIAARLGGRPRKRARPRWYQTALVPVLPQLPGAAHDLR